MDRKKVNGKTGPFHDPVFALPAALFALTIFQAGLIFFLATPYRSFPADDYHYALWLEDSKVNLLSSVTRHQNPLFELYIMACDEVSALISSARGFRFVLSGLIANTLTLTCLILIPFQIFRRIEVSILCGLLFITSGWTNTYYFFFSYTPMPTALLVLAFTCFLQPQIQPELSFARARVFHALSGAVLGLAFWSSPGALIMICSLLALPLIFPGHEPHQQAVPRVGWHLGGFCATFFPLAFFSLTPYLAHILENISTHHYVEAGQKFGSVPFSPPFTFIRILWEYSRFQTGLALAVTLVVGLFFLGLFIRSFLAKPDSSILPLPKPVVLCGVLLLLCVVHATAVDLLPITKLGRIHFQAFPFLLLLLVIFPGSLVAFTGSSQAMKTTMGAYVVLLCLSIGPGMGKSLEARQLRFGAPEYLSKNTSNNVYCLREDPHSGFLSEWLKEIRIRLLSEKELGKTINDQIRRGIKGFLLLGPTGAGSGNSILRRGILPDFHIDFPPTFRKTLTILPYYAFYPPFLFEEEICQALYFAGRTPSQSTPESSLKLIRW